MSKIEYQLSALDQFVCTGSDCPANCCRAGWKIEVEPETYKRWQAITDEQERNRLLAVVVKETENHQDILRMKLDNTGCCQLLDDDNLCSLQQQHGHAMLSEVCQSYPRVNAATSIHSFASLYLSCPEVAKAVLFNNRASVFQKRSSGQVPLLTAEDQLRHALTEMLDRVMTEGKYSLAARAFYVADVIVKLSQLSVQHGLTATSFQLLVASSKNELYQIGLGIKTGRLRPSPLVAGAFWRAILSIGHGAQLLPELDASSALMKLLSSAPAMRDEQCKAVYTELQRLRDTTQDSWRAYDAHFLRYLHASLMCNGFPWNPQSNNYVATLMRVMVPFALVRLRLWLLAEKQGSLQDQDIVDITYKTERAISHNNLVLNILNRNPALLELDEYHVAFLSL